jgi:hypothetical protein
VLQGADQTNGGAVSRARNGVAVGVAVGLAYALVVRLWFLTWGASAKDARSALPGDQIVPGPRTTGTPRDRDRGRPRRRLALAGGERNRETTRSFP